MHETAILLHTSKRGKKDTREGKKGAREGKKGAAPFYFGLAGTLQDGLSGEKCIFLYTSKHSSLVKFGAVWLNVKTYQTDCPVKNKNFRID